MKFQVRSKQFTLLKDKESTKEINQPLVILADVSLRTNFKSCDISILIQDMQVEVWRNPVQ